MLRSCINELFDDVAKGKGIGKKSQLCLSAVVLVLKDRDFIYGVIMDKGKHVFEEFHPEMLQVIGTAVVQLLAGEETLSRESIADMVHKLYAHGLDDAAVQRAVDVLILG